MIPCLGNIGKCFARETFYASTSVRYSNFVLTVGDQLCLPFHAISGGAHGQT